ncbi:MAG: hydroxymethylbilane synthase [Gammaproteobacteria bacterium]|jgi:hydroxymethylbilane synthase
MPESPLRIVTRRSPLALWQANHVHEKLRSLHPELAVEVIGVSTEADRFQNKSLASMGGKGAFIKELEQALLSGRADLAVHSMKDVTVEMPEDLALPVILRREDPGDAFVSNHYASLEELPAGARVGTSSLRRRCQIMHARQDLEVCDIRGNVGTRLRKLDEGSYDALVLAASGLHRLALGARITARLDTEQLLPAIGQGALGIETRHGDADVLSLLKALDDEETHICVSAERAVSRRLNGGCLAPVAGFAELRGDRVHIAALVGRPDGTELIRDTISGPADEAEALGAELGERLLQQGADRILRDIMGHDPT